MMKAVQTYTPVLAILSAALLLVAAGLDKMQLSWKRLAPLPSRREIVGAGFGYRGVVACPTASRCVEDRHGTDTTRGRRRRPPREEVR
jgi:hypothetical protein